MRILHVYRDFLSEGGVPHQSRKLVEAQLQLGHELLTFSKEPDPEGPVFSVAGAAHTSVPPGVPGVEKFKEALGTFSPDVVHFSGLGIPAHHLWLREVTRRHLPYVVSPHGLLAPLGQRVRFEGKKGRLKIRAKMAFHALSDVPMLQTATAVHCQSKFEAELASKAGARATFVVPMGVDTNWVLPIAPRSSAPPNVTTFTYLGRLDTYHKGLDLITQAFDSVSALPGVRPHRVILAGTPAGDFENLVARSPGHRGYLDIRGPAWDKDKEALWAETDYFLAMFRYAGMARACGESVGHGVPLLSSREGNWGDWTSDAGMGLCIPLDVNAISKELSNLLTGPHDQDKYAAWSEAAYRFALDWNWNHVASEICDAYSKFAGE